MHALVILHEQIFTEVLICGNHVDSLAVTEVTLLAVEKQKIFFEGDTLLMGVDQSRPKPVIPVYHDLLLVHFHSLFYDLIQELLVQVSILLQHDLLFFHLNLLSHLLSFHPVFLYLVVFTH